VADSQFDRPVVSLQSAKGMNDLEDCQGVGGLWFVGAYALFSVPLLENGVESAIRVSAAIGAPCPWKPTFSSPTKCNKNGGKRLDKEEEASGIISSLFCSWKAAIVVASVAGVCIHIVKRKN
jgi:hypothetical protein